jgi:hypothetical protein
MKLNERMRYPHSVLSEFSADYVSGDFKAEFSQNLTNDNELKIQSKLEIGNPDLLKLIEKQEAAVGYFLICRRTYYNRLQEAAIGTTEKFFEAEKLFGAIQIRPVVWTLQNIDNFESDLINPEFGESVPIAKGSVIAMGPEFRFSIDRKKFKPFDSIFELARDDNVQNGEFAVDPESDRIQIVAEHATYEKIAGIRHIEARNILLASIYMPALMDVISRIQKGDNMEAYKWYRVFKAKCDDLALDIANESQSPLKLAQTLLRQPIQKTIKIAESTS